MPRCEVYLNDMRFAFRASPLTVRLPVANSRDAPRAKCALAPNCMQCRSGSSHLQSCACALISVQRSVGCKNRYTNKEYLYYNVIDNSAESDNVNDASPENEQDKRSLSLVSL